MSRRLSYLLAAALWLFSFYEASMIAVRMVTGNVSSTPLLGGILAPGSGPERTVALALMFVFVWVLLDLALHFFRIWREQKAVVMLASSSRWDARTLTTGTMAQRRAAITAAQPASQSEVLHEVLPAAAALDATASDNQFSHTRAFIWALPVLGFIGTALGLAASIAGFSDALKGDSSVLIQRLGQQVIPGLSSAFIITMAALGAATVGHLCITTLQSWNSDVLSRLDDSTMRLLTRIPRIRQPAPAFDAERLEAAITNLAEVIQQINRPGDDGLRNAAADLSRSATALREAASVMAEVAQRPYQVTITRPDSRVAAAGAR